MGNTEAVVKENPDVDMAKVKPDVTEFLKCKICKKETVEILFVPCKHALVCLKCANAYSAINTKCPECETVIEKIYEIIIPELVPELVALKQNRCKDYKILSNVELFLDKFIYLPCPISTCISTEAKLEGKPVIENSINGKPVIETSINGKPVIETSINGTPVIETSINGTPVIETSINGTPVIETSIEEERNSIEDSSSRDGNYSIDENETSEISELSELSEDDCKEYAYLPETSPPVEEFMSMRAPATMIMEISPPSILVTEIKTYDKKMKEFTYTECPEYF